MSDRIKHGTSLGFDVPIHCSIVVRNLRQGSACDGVMVCNTGAVCSC